MNFKDMDLASEIIELFQKVDDRIDIDESNLTPIQEFYKDAKIFVTGGTGFLGQILIEKLLRSCPVSTIYVLARKKKGTDMESRLEEIFNDQLFDRMKKVRPDFRTKIVAVEGDCARPDLGLSLQDKTFLVDEVNIVFHVAATVRFDEKLEKATSINVRATKDLSLLAQKMRRLKSFIHVSSAFTNCMRNVIEERVYPTPMHYTHLLDASERLDSFLLEKLTPCFTKNYPNTYIYTKQIAEDVVKQETRGVPAGIYRPAIVVSTYKEPVRGWINNLYGATGVLYGAGVGLLRVLYCDEKSDANIIPVDMCINGLIASAWDTAQRFQNASDENDNFEIPIYNYESTNDKLIKWEEFKKLTSKYSYPFPSRMCLWVYVLYLIKSYKKYVVMAFFLHLIPGMITDAILFCIGKKMRLVRAYRKIHTFAALISYFTVRSFDFKSFNIQKMLHSMSKEDRNIFFCDLKELDWDEFFRTYGLGARVYLAKDPIDTIPEGRRFYGRLERAHRLVITVLGLLGATILWHTVSTIYNYIFVQKF